ncbi:MAG: Gfo/Idh/MocA family oxidoreductase [Lentisphaerota bacterium]
MTRIGIVGTGIIALPNFMHFDAAQQALAAGKHVFCERADAISKFDFAY